MAVVAACGSGPESTSARDEAPTTRPAPTAAGAEPRNGAADTAGIEAFQIDGVWVFQHQPEFSMDALHGGTPEIVDGCLVIDKTIVVWH